MAVRTARKREGSSRMSAAPDRQVALIRGINVGRAKRVAMADLRALVEGLGYRDVDTLLNSGNVVFTVPAGMKGTPSSRIESCRLFSRAVASMSTREAFACFVAFASASETT